MNNTFKIILSTIIAISLSGCISPKTDAFLLGAGLGAGATYYFLNNGKIDGISKNGINKKPRGQVYDTSIPAELEWHYLEEDLFEQASKIERGIGY